LHWVRRFATYERARAHDYRGQVTVARCHPDAILDANGEFSETLSVRPMLTHVSQFSLATATEKSILAE
jgi:hypothetical protein